MKKYLRATVAAACLLFAGVSARAAELTVWGLQTFNTAGDEYLGQMVKDFGKQAGIDAEYVVVPANVLNQRLAASFEAHTPPDASTLAPNESTYSHNGVSGATVKARCHNSP